MAAGKVTLLRGPGVKKPNLRGTLFKPGQIIPVGTKAYESAVVTDALLLETGDYLLLESGDKLLLES